MTTISSVCAKLALAAVTLTLVAVPLGASAGTEPVILTPAQGTYQPQVIVVSGMADAGSSVRIMRGAITLSTATADAEGNWSRQLGFTNGPQTITAIARDASGVDTSSAPRAFVVDSIRPKVTITTSEMIPQISDLKVEGTASDNIGVTRVELVITDLAFGGEDVVTATLASPDGLLTTWSYRHQVSTCLCQVTATSYDEAGNKSAVDSVTIIEVG